MNVFLPTPFSSGNMTYGKYATLLLSSLLLSCSLLLAACTSVKPQGEVVDIGGDVTLLLQPAALLPPAGSHLQKIRARFRDQPYKLLMQVQLSPQLTELQLTGLSLNMTRLFTVAYSEAGIRVWKSPLFTAPFDARYLLADYQVMQLPFLHLQPALRGAKVRDSERRDSQQHIVRLRDIESSEGQPVIHIEYVVSGAMSGAVDYCHLLRQYCLHIEPISDGGLPYTGALPDTVERN